MLWNLLTSILPVIDTSSLQNIYLWCFMSVCGGLQGGPVCVWWTTGRACLCVVDHREGLSVCGGPQGGSVCVWWTTGRVCLCVVDHREGLSVCGGLQGGRVSLCANHTYSLDIIHTRSLQPGIYHFCFFKVFV